MNSVEQARHQLGSGQPDAAVTLLDRAIATGDSAAAIELAAWRMQGRGGGRNLVEARRLFGVAAQLGDAGAGALHRALITHGFGRDGDFSKGRALLNAASVDDEVAARQCALLAAMAIDDHGDPTVEPTIERLVSQPDVSIARAAFTPDECAELIRLATPRLVPAVIVDPTSGQLRPDPIRSSDSAAFAWLAEDVFIHAINRRLARLTMTDVAAGEPLQILRYRRGGEYRPHVDSVADAINQRIATALLYLNDDYDGGETHFIMPDVKLRGAVGDVVIFRNVTADGVADPSSRHAGLPVVRGQKYLASRWIRQRPLIDDLE